MGFWVYMLISALIIPLIMTVFGAVFFKRPPAGINHIIGYRTAMSMKNIDTWRLAHRYCGKLWLMIGTPLLPVTTGVMLFFINASEGTVGVVSLALLTLQLLLIILSVVLTERALKRTFDASGNRYGEVDGKAGTEEHLE